jgi:hypothetical protein
MFQKDGEIDEIDARREGGVTLTRQKKQAKRCTKKARMTIKTAILLSVGPIKYESSSLARLCGPAEAGVGNKRW